MMVGWTGTKGKSVFALFKSYFQTINKFEDRLNKVSDDVSGSN